MFGMNKVDDENGELYNVYHHVAIEIADSE